MRYAAGRGRPSPLASAGSAPIPAPSSPPTAEGPEEKNELVAYIDVISSAGVAEVEKSPAVETTAIVRERPDVRTCNTPAKKENKCR